MKKNIQKIVKSELDKIPLRPDVGRQLYDLLWNEYVEKLTFDINLLSAAKGMHEARVKMDGVFLDYNDKHTEQLQKMIVLLKYLKDNPKYWDFRKIEAFYNEIPLQNEDKNNDRPLHGRR